MIDYPAGPDLNLLIAERVMGWLRDDEGNNTDRAPWFWNRLCWMRDLRTVWTPSTSIEHAYEVIQHLRLCWSISGPSQTVPPDPGVILYLARFAGTNRREYLGVAESAPLAVCRAALLAVKVTP